MATKFERLLQEQDEDSSLSMAYCSIMDFLRQMGVQSHEIKRQQAQVDAMLKCKYGDCYEPPQDSDDDMNILFNSIITDEATAKALVSNGSKKQDDKPAPVTPSPAPPPSKQSPSLVQRLALGAGALGLLGGGMGAGSFLANLRQPKYADFSQVEFEAEIDRQTQITTGN